jgi:hypothetical protein
MYDIMEQRTGEKRKRQRFRLISVRFTSRRMDTNGLLL